MKNKKDDPFGPGLVIVIIIAIIVSWIISHKLELRAFTGNQLMRLLCGVASGIYGIVYYIIKKFRK